MLHRIIVALQHITIPTPKVNTSGLSIIIINDLAYPSSTLWALTICGIGTFCGPVRLVAPTKENLNMKLKTAPLYLFAALALAAAPAMAKKTAADFVNTAAVANQFEIDSSKLALQKSQDDGVKNFAQQMVDDHTKAGDELKTASASSKDKIIPPESLDKKHQDKMDKLNKLDGKKFDKEYIEDQEDAHKAATKLFDDYAKNGDDPALKDFAAKTAPTLHQHWDMIEQVEKNYGKAPAPANTMSNTTTNTQ